MRFALAIAFAMLLALAPAASSVHADETETADVRAGMCADFDGLSFVFCVALCEARECDHQDPNDERCAVLARGFSDASGGAKLPCAPAPARRTI